MEKILLLNPLQALGDLADNVKSRCPNITITPNFEQVYAQVRMGEIERICIILDTSTETPLNAVKKIHAIDPTLPIIVWEETDPTPMNTEFEIYGDIGDFMGGAFFDVMENFYNGTLSLGLFSEMRKLNKTIE